MLKYLKLKYIFIFYAIIRFTLHMIVIDIDGKGRLYSCLLLLLVLFSLQNINVRKYLLKLPYSIWTMWVIFAITNTMIKGMNFNMEVWQFMTFISAPMLILYLIIPNNRSDHNNLLNIITTAAFLNTIFLFFFEDYIYFSGEGLRLGSTLNSNELGIDAFFSIFFLYMNFIYKKIRLPTFIFLSILPAFIVIISASRAAFAPLALLFMSHFIIVRSKNIFRTILILCIGIIMTQSLITYIDNEFIIMDRIRAASIEGQDSYYTGTILDNLGSRTAYYLFGFDIFLDNPISGVGLGNYKFYNPLSNQPNHVELMIQLSELGIIGFSLFFLFNYWIGYNLINRWINQIKYRKITEAYIVGFLCILSLSFATWTHPHILIFCLYGFIISYINSLEDII